MCLSEVELNEITTLGILAESRLSRLLPETVQSFQNPSPLWFIEPRYLSEFVRLGQLAQEELVFRQFIKHQNGPAAAANHILPAPATDDPYWVSLFRSRRFIGLADLIYLIPRFDTLKKIFEHGQPTTESSSENATVGNSGTSCEAMHRTFEHGRPTTENISENTIVGDSGASSKALNRNDDVLVVKWDIGVLFAQMD